MYPTAAQYRTLGFVLIGHGFEKHGRDLQKHAETLARSGAITRDITFEEIEQKTAAAMRDRAVAEELCTIFDRLNDVWGGSPL